MAHAKFSTILRSRLNLCLYSILGLALMFGFSGSSLLALDFPATGYVPIIVDGVDAGVEPCRDILEVGYQQDGTNSFFSVTVNCTDVGFNNQRFSLFLDTNGDGVNDYLIWMDNPQKVDLYSWDGALWQNTFSTTADFADPNLDPDNTIFLGVASIELGLDGSGAQAVGASTGRSKDKLVLDCNDPTCQNSGDSTGSGEVGTGFLSITPDTLCAGTSSAVTANITDTRVITANFVWSDSLNVTRFSDTGVSVSSSQAISTFTPPDTEGFWKIQVTYFDLNGDILPDNISPETDDIFLNVQGPTAAAGLDATVCAGSSITLGGSPSAFGGVGPYTFSWSPTTGLDDPSLPNPKATPAIDTTYSLTVTDQNGCPATSTVTVFVAALPTANAGSDTSICVGDSYVLGGAPAALGGTGPYDYTWSPSGSLDDPSASNPTASPSLSTTYQLEISDQNSCIDTATVSVTANTCGTTLYRSTSGPILDPVNHRESVGFFSGAGFIHEMSDLGNGAPTLVFYAVETATDTLRVTIESGKVTIRY